MVLNIQGIQYIFLKQYQEEPKKLLQQMLNLWELLKTLMKLY